MEETKCMTISTETETYFDDIFMNATEITKLDILSKLFQENKGKTLLILLYAFIESGAWIAFSLLSQTLFSIVHGSMT